MKLINGNIPPGTTCEFSDKCTFKHTAFNGKGCPVCDGKISQNQISCAVARAHVIILEEEDDA